MKDKITNVKDSIVDKSTDIAAKGLVKVTLGLTSKRAVIRRLTLCLCTIPFALSAVAVTACAAGGGGGTDPEGYISAITTLLKTWIPRLGAMIIVVGGIQLGIGFKDDNADGKTRGMQCMIGGAIVAAIGKMVDF